MQKKTDINEFFIYLCDKVSVLPEDVKVKCRKRELVDLKIVFIKTLYDEGYLKYHIAKLLGLNHATVLHHLKNADFNIKTYHSIRNTYQKLNA